MGTVHAPREEFERVLEMIPSMRGADATERTRLYGLFQETERLLQAEPIDFFKYRLFERTPEQVSDYLMRRQYAQLCGRVNDPVAASGLVDKVAFYQEYDAFLGREWTYGAPQNKEYFHYLCDRNLRLVYKARKGAYGRGFSIVYTREPVWLWEDALVEEALIEELLVQHGSLAELFPHAVNSVRVVTAIDPQGEPEVLAAVLRCGRGNMITDSGEGLFACVDLADGVLCTPGASHFLECYDRHPDTGVAFCGLQLPNWEGLLDRVREVALLHPELRLMNWDWACREDGLWCLFEGNFAGGIGPCQEAGAHGLKTDIYRALGLDL